MVINMLTAPSLLVCPAKDAGMPVPEDIENYNADEYPHWAMFVTMQLCRPLPHYLCPWSNAKLIAGISEDKIRATSIGDILSMGYE